jgi:hypothetical protein
MQQCNVIFYGRLKKNKVTHKLTNLIRDSGRFQIPLEVDRDVVSQMKLHKEFQFIAAIKGDLPQGCGESR